MRRPLPLRRDSPQRQPDQFRRGFDPWGKWPRVVMIFRSGGVDALERTGRVGRNRRVANELIENFRGNRRRRRVRQQHSSSVGQRDSSWYASHPKFRTPPPNGDGPESVLVRKRTGPNCQHLERRRLAKRASPHPARIVQGHRARTRQHRQCEAARHPGEPRSTADASAPSTLDALASQHPSRAASQHPARVSVPAP
jgi:hypothetical protein